MPRMKIERIIKYMHFVYMIKNSSDELYVGITKDPNTRVQAHNSKQGAQFTKTNSNFKVVFLEECKTLTEARSREVQIKKWRREKKEILIKRYQNGLSTKN